LSEPLKSLTLTTINNDIERLIYIIKASSKVSVDQFF
jgi:hypothetical protein